eukprot:s371_g12.t1
MQALAAPHRNAAAPDLRRGWRCRRAAEPRGIVVMKSIYAWHFQVHVLASAHFVCGSEVLSRPELGTTSPHVGGRTDPSAPLILVMTNSRPRSAIAQVWSFELKALEARFGNAVTKSQEPQTSQKEVGQSSQSTLQPQPILGEPPGLTESEAKALQHLRGLRSLNMELTDSMMNQLQELKEQLTVSSKPLTHGHINKMNKYRNQLLSAAKKISSLDQEWNNFTNQTMEKIKMHAQLYQQCRADLMEQYNSKFQEFNAVKAEMSAASASLLEQNPPMMELPKMPDLTEQLQAFQTQIMEEGTVGPIDPLDQIDLTEEDEGMEESDGDGVSKKTKTSPKLKSFRHSTSPQKVANQHLKVKPDKEPKDSKKEDKDK